jgi:hypothetical protein
MSLWALDISHVSQDVHQEVGRILPSPWTTLWILRPFALQVSLLLLRYINEFPEISKH